MKTLNKTTKTFYDVKTTSGTLVKAVLKIETRENNKGELVLSISGALYDKYKSINEYKLKASAFGQVDMDIDYEEASNDLKRILDIWKEYHLNDMHAECIHQEEAGIRELASQPLYKAKYLSQDQRDLYTMKYSIKKFFLNVDEAKENIPEGYKLNEVEKTLRGHESISECEFGLFGKECPVCGYKYGHGWTYRPIPEEILVELGLK